MTEQRPKKLLDQVRDAIRPQHCSTRTEETYRDWHKNRAFYRGAIRHHPH